MLSLWCTELPVHSTGTITGTFDQYCIWLLCNTCRTSLWAVSCHLAHLSFRLPALLQNDGSSSVRPKPGFGIGNRNHDQVSVSVSAPELFLLKPKLSSIFIPWYYFSKDALLFGLETENTLVQSNHFISCQLPDLFVRKMPSYLPFWYLIPRKIRIRYGVPNLK